MYLDMSVFHIFYVPLFAYTHDPWRWVAHRGGVDELYRSFSIGMYAQIGQIPLTGSFVEAASISSTYHLLGWLGITKHPFSPIPFHILRPLILHLFKGFQRGKKKGLNNETKHIFFFFKACPKKLRECLALCTQLPTAPSSSIFLSFPSSWSFLISPRCLGIAVFLEANLSQSLQMPPWVWIPWRRCLSSSTTCFFAGVPWQVINS